MKMNVAKTSVFLMLLLPAITQAQAPSAETANGKTSVAKTAAKTGGATESPEFVAHRVDQWLRGHKIELGNDKRTAVHNLVVSYISGLTKVKTVAAKKELKSRVYNKMLNELKTQTVADLFVYIDEFTNPKSESVKK
jgi:hypothetical protein